MNRREIKRQVKNASVKISHGGWHGRVLRDFNYAPLLELLSLDPFDNLPRSPLVSLIKSKPDKGSLVYRAEMQGESGSEEIFIKLFSNAITFEMMKRRMREGKGRALHHYPIKLLKLLYEPSLARRSWNAAAACQLAGIPVADHLLFLRRRRGAFKEEVLVTRGVTPRSANNVRNYFLLNFNGTLGREKLVIKRKLIADIGALTRRIHDSGLMFQDFKLHNLVLEEKDPARLVSIDLSEVSLRPGYDETILLERLNPSLKKSGFSKLDRIRLLSAFLKNESDHQGCHDLFDRIEARARSQGRTIC